MKKFLAIALTLALTASTMLGFAVDPTNFKEVPVDAKMQISLDGLSYSDSMTRTVSRYNDKYDLKATIDMTNVTAQLKYLAGQKPSEALNATVTGEFNIKVSLPSNILDGLYFNNHEFSLDTASTSKDFDDIFVAPNKDDVKITAAKSLVEFTVVTKPGLKGSDIFVEENGEIKSLMGDYIYLECTDVVMPAKAGIYTFKGSFDGYTDITKADGSKIYHVPYKSSEASAKLTLKAVDDSSTPSGGGSKVVFPYGGSTPSTPSAPSTYEVEVNIGTGATGGDAGTTTVTPGSEYVIPTEIPSRDGYVFNGWSVNGRDVEPGTVITINEDTVITAKWINLNAPADLNSKDHMAYIKGYPEGDVRPEENITREEVATIFYRLLTDEKRAEIETTENNFSDVSADTWSNAAISTLANGGYIKGYPDGTFKPTAPIERAEFVAIAARFTDAPEGVKAYFKDVKGHWAEKYIAAVADTAWVSGYEDGTFRPDNTITRAEVMKIVNNVLVRYTDEKNMSVEGMILFPDNASSEWYYYDVIEATNGHDYTRREDGYNEDWTSIIINEIIG